MRWWVTRGVINSTIWQCIQVTLSWCPIRPLSPRCCAAYSIGLNYSRNSHWVLQPYPSSRHKTESYQCESILLVCQPQEPMATETSISKLHGSVASDSPPDEMERHGSVRGGHSLL